jgi:hypothetical protein
MLKDGKALHRHTNRSNSYDIPEEGRLLLLFLVRALGRGSTHQWRAKHAIDESVENSE